MTSYLFQVAPVKGSATVKQMKRPKVDRREQCLIDTDQLTALLLPR